MGNSNGKPIAMGDEVSLNHFRLLRVVGKGAFGKVRIVERKDTGLTFALKYIRKDEVIRSESVRNIIRERRMLQHLNHPFLCNLRYSFQDMEYLYIVVDLMNGGDLRFHISRKTFTEEAVRFWIAELGCALRYVHKQGIVHRDVKPDNVLLDSEGHVHLADFNVASDFKPNRPLTSKSGTLAYLAPEVYIGKGYSSEVDWWGLGVLFYEAIYNKRPFEGNNQEQLMNSIIRGEPAFPVTSPAVSMPCNHAISSLLEKSKSLRIGAVSFNSFTDNPFFREVDFEALERKEIEPIFCPSSDKTNFDATYDLEELLLEEAPLEARARKQKPRAELRSDATYQEKRTDELYRMVETMFTPFNYTTLPEYRAPVTEENRPITEPNIAGDKDWPLVDPSNRSRKIDNVPSIPTPRSGTPASLNRTRSSQHSAEGSPPQLGAVIPHNLNASQTDSTALPPSIATGDAAPPVPPVPRTLRYDDSQPQYMATVNGPAGNKNNRQRSKSRPSGGLSQDSGSWSDQAGGHMSGRSEEPPQQVKKSDKGMLGFLSRKKGRDRSPKPGKEKERGVIGKDGARVVVGH